MQQNLIKKIREFLKENKIDYLLVNSTNEFLVEYAPLDENSRYLLTNFSGSTGDAIISQKDIFLFVDGRYHDQADSEVDKKLITVVKMKIGESFYARALEKLSSDKIFAIVSKKNSQGRLEIFETELKKKNIKIKVIDKDPICPPPQTLPLKGGGSISEKIDVKYTGCSTEEKFKKIAKHLKNDEAILLTNLEEISYFLNERDFSNNYSSKIQKGKCLITSKDYKCFEELKIPKEIKCVFIDKTQINAYDYAILGDKAQSLKTNYIKEMKSIKTKAEIEHYKKCFERTDKVLLVTREFIEKNNNISEYDIAQFLEENFYKFGAKSLSFKSIVAKDQNAAHAHYSKNSKDEILKDGSLILIDCGAYYEGGYATDITRVFVKGKPSSLQKKVYTTVLKGFLKAFNKKVTDKTTGFTLDKAARKVVNDNKPEGFEFSHSLGHGIGISVHESPPSLAFSPLAKTPLNPNMCFTIEPGLYNPNKFGVRLENSCYLEEVKGKKEKVKRELVIKSFTNMCFEQKLIDFELLTATEKRQLKQFQIL